MSETSYADFLASKAGLYGNAGFDPVWMPDFLYDFQRALVAWSLRKGRAAIFADCGLGKTPMQLVWAENVRRVTGKPTLILTPLAVAAQTCDEAAKFGIEAHRSSDGRHGSDVVVTNYDRLHNFRAEDFGGIVCDESSILKSFEGATKAAVTDAMSRVHYRLLATATAAPNDYIELGTSSEALGYMDRKHVLSRFFTHDGGETSKWALKGHARTTAFWRWVCSWARACRKPSDLGFSDDRFVLPPMTERHHAVKTSAAPDGMLMAVDAAVGLNDEREERRATIAERCEMAADLVRSSDSAVVWCHLNAEGERLARIIPGAVEVSGATPDDDKERAYRGFADGSIRVLITKPKIGAWGLNWQHCAHVVTFASHSYEQHYQSVRRCWRFGQTRPVTVDVISTEAETRVRESMVRKSAAADEMFSALVRHMNDALVINKATAGDGACVEVPTWV